MPTLQRDGLAGPRIGPTSPVPGLVPLVLAAVVAVGLLASVVAARYTGAAAPLPGGLTDAGPVVRWALPLVRVVHDVAASLTIGSLLLAATMIPGRTRAESAALDEPRRAAALRVVTAAAFVWAVAGAVGVVFTFADAAGMPLSDPLFGQNLAGSGSSARSWRSSSRPSPPWRAPARRRWRSPCSRRSPSSSSASRATRAARPTTRRPSTRSPRTC